MKQLQAAGISNCWIIFCAYTLIMKIGHFCTNDILCLRNMTSSSSNFTFVSVLAFRIRISRNSGAAHVTKRFSVISQKVAFLEKFHSNLEMFHSNLETFHSKVRKFHSIYLTGHRCSTQLMWTHVAELASDLWFRITLCRTSSLLRAWISLRTLDQSVWSSVSRVKAGIFQFFDKLKVK